MREVDRINSTVWNLRPLSLVFCGLFALTLGLCLGVDVKAETVVVRLKVVSLSPSVIMIEEDLGQASAQWSFLSAYGRMVGLGERIDNFTATDSGGHSVAVRRISPTDFRSEKAVSRISYQVRVSEPSNSADSSHVSWLNERGGYLMLADLLPLSVDGQPGTSTVQIELQLPTQWNVASSAEANPRGQYEVPDVLHAVFLVGKGVRSKHKQIGGTDFNIAAVGEWPFPIDSITNIAARILRDHARHVGFELQRRVTLMLFPLAGTVGAEQWTAETRGSNVVLLLGEHSTPDVLLGRLSIVLTHELFHLWVPGSLSFDADYDWFFEGFTLYQALRCAVRLGFIGFQEYLSTMARVYDSYLATGERDWLSLLDASQRRWTMASSLAYDKGMLVAFLCDLSLRGASRNRRSLDDVYRELFRQQRIVGAKEKGNDAIIGILNREQGTDWFSKRYISTPSAIRLEVELPAYGLVVESSENHSHLKVVQALSSQQRQLLRSLGFGKQRN